MRLLRTSILIAIVAAFAAAAASFASPPTRSSAAMSIAVVSAPAKPAAPARDTAADQRLAETVLAQLQRTHTLLEGVTVRMSATPKGEEAVSYYRDGEIVISTSHTVSIEKILAHEIWHIIDWRDNGRLDWGEDLPPADSSDYLI